MTESDGSTRFPGYSGAVEIARGGQARILRAYNERLTRFEAIKIYVPATEDHAAADRARRRFDDEARIAGAYRNPHIIVVHRSEVHGGVPCLFMEYIDGPSLRTVLDNLDSKLSLPQIISILSGVADALDQLAGSPVPVIHRDVKPDNILLERDDDEGYGRAVLADFGVALRATSSDAVTDSAGTPRYAAPEQLLRTPLTPRSDQYALACTAYELFAGGPPHQATSIEDRLRQIATGAAESIPALASVDRRLRRADRVFVRALAVSPAQRYPTARAFVDDLAFALGLTRPGVRERAVAAARRHPRASSTAAAASTVVLVAAGVVGYQSLTDLRETVYPMLARPGLYDPCPDLDGRGFAPDPRFMVDARGIPTSEDQLRVIGGFGSFQIVERDGVPEQERRDTAGRLVDPVTFLLDPSRILQPATITSSTTYERGLPPNASCRYLQNLASPPDGAVLNIYSDAAPHRAAKLGRDPGIEQELMLDPPQTQVVGLDDNHKTTFTTWPATRPPYDVCVARLTGYDGADASPLLVLHQARELTPTVCDKLTGMIDGQLNIAWTTMSPDQRREPLPNRTNPEPLSEPELWRAVRDGTEPCGDHAAVGLERRGEVVSVTHGAGCWFETGDGQRVALFRTPPESAPGSYSGEPESLPINGHHVDGTAVSTLTLGPEPVPVLWVANRGENDALRGGEARQGVYLLNALVGRAIGNRAVR